MARQLLKHIDILATMEDVPDDAGTICGRELKDAAIILCKVWLPLQPIIAKSSIPVIRKEFKGVAGNVTGIRSNSNKSSLSIIIRREKLICFF